MTDYMGQRNSELSKSNGIPEDENNWYGNG
jgi:hypothetical protein